MSVLGLTRFAFMLALMSRQPEGAFAPAFVSQSSGSTVPKGVPWIASRSPYRLRLSMASPPDILLVGGKSMITRRTKNVLPMRVDSRAQVFRPYAHLNTFGHKDPDSRHVGMHIRLKMPRGEFSTGFESLDWDADFRFLPRRRGRRVGPSGTLRLTFGQRHRRARVIAWARLWPIGGTQAWESDLGAGAEGETIFKTTRRGQWVGAWRGRARLMAAQAGTDLLRVDGALLPKSLLAQTDFSLTESIRGFEDEHRNVRALSFFDGELGYARGNWLRMVIFASVATQSRQDEALMTAVVPVRWATGAMVRLRPGGERGRLQVSYQVAQRQRPGRERPWMHVVMLGI